MNRAARALPTCDLILGLYGRLPKETVVVIVPDIRAYVDETATHGNPDDPIILSCVASTLLKWQLFDRKWKALTKRAGVKHIHAHDFSDIDLQRRMDAALSVDRAIHDYVTFGVHTVLWPTDFAAYREAKGSNLHTLLDSDYGLSFRFILSFMHTATAALLGGQSQIYVLYEIGHKNCGSAAVIFSLYAEYFPDGPVRSVAPVRKGDFCGTEAADIRGSLILDVERSRTADVSDVDVTVAENLAQLRTQYRVPWFRLELKLEMLMALKDHLILSRPRFTRLYGHLLSPLAASVKDSIA
jgi:hypothetical protein